MAMKTTNQLNPPLPKRKRVDKLGNDRRRAYFKSGNTTVLLCENITENAARALSNHLEDLCIKLGTKLEGHIIWTR